MVCLIPKLITWHCFMTFFAHLQSCGVLDLQFDLKCKVSASFWLNFLCNIFPRQYLSGPQFLLLWDQKFNMAKFIWTKISSPPYCFKGFALSSKNSITTTWWRSSDLHYVKKDCIGIKWTFGIETIF